MKNKQSRPTREPSSQSAPGRKLFGRISIPSFGTKDHLPKRTGNSRSNGKWSRRSLLWLALTSLIVLLILQQCKRNTMENLSAQAVESIQENILYRYHDCDYLVFEATTMCGLPSVTRQDYREYLVKDEELEKAPENSQDLSPQNENYIRRRPKINVDGLVYFEKLTKSRARLIYDNGACEIFDFEDLTYNIQEAKQCGQFSGIPRNGEVTEFVNLLYIESLEKVRCEGKELYRAQLGVRASSCATLRIIADCGVGLFSVYVYRKLRERLEELNPHTDFKYRRTVELAGCEC